MSNYFDHLLLLLIRHLRTTNVGLPYTVFGRPFIKRFAACYQTVVCPVRPVCLSVGGIASVALVYCGQTVGWIKMKLGMMVGLGPAHIVLDGDPATLPQKGHIFGQ